MSMSDVPADGKKVGSKLHGLIDVFMKKLLPKVKSNEHHLRNALLGVHAVLSYNVGMVEQMFVATYPLDDNEWDERRIAIRRDACILEGKKHAASHGHVTGRHG